MLSIRVKDYMKSVKASLVDIDDEIEEAFILMCESAVLKKRIWVIGNGGSMAIAQHFAQDMLKMCNVRAQAINCPSVITAFANDDQFEYCFFNPISRLIDEGDIIVIFSCSGKSRNYIEFVSGFSENRNKIISIVGGDGGFLKEKSDVCIHVESMDYQICETAFCVISDIIVKSMELQCKK